MTRPGSDKVQRRLDARKKVDEANSDYLEPSSGMGDSPDYQRIGPAVPAPITSTYTGLTTSPRRANTVDPDPDYFEIIQ